MTVQTDVSRSGPYAGAGTTGPFTVGFRFLADEHLRVIRTSASGVNTDLSLTTDYSVTGAGGISGTITTTIPVALGQTITILRNVPFTQEADYVDNDAFPAESHEAALDLLTMQTQQNKEIISRSIVVSPTSPSGISLELPNPTPNNLLGWNTAGDEITNIDPNSFGGLVTYGSTRAETFDGNGANTDFVLQFDALVSPNCDVSVGGVVQTPDVNFVYLPSTRTVRFLTGAPAVGVGNVLVRYGTVLNIGEASGVQGQTAIGAALITAADAAAARTTIGAVGLTGNQSIGGDKTFTGTGNAFSNPLAVANGTTSGHAVNKGQLDAVTILASALEAQGFADSTKLITPATLAASFQGANQSLSAASPSFQIFPGKLIKMWIPGNAVAATSGTSTTLTMPKTVAEVLDVKVTPKFSVSSASGWHWLSSNTTQIAIQRFNVSNGDSGVAFVAEITARMP